MCWMLYGANGYTGALIARHAHARGLEPILAGRRAEALGPLAAELRCPFRSFSLDDPHALVAHLAGVTAVLNCAGPFSRTAPPLMDACLASGAHYLDITGEIDVIEAAAARGPRAKQAGLTLLPAVGFDVVPTDCLAAALAERLPGAKSLQLAFASSGAVSRGTALTVLEMLPAGGRARIEGVIQRVPTAAKSLRVPFRHQTLSAMTVPWGDVASAYYTTRIPNIEVYLAASRFQIFALRRRRFLLPLLAWPPLAAVARRVVEFLYHGPNEAERVAGRTSLWGRVTDATGDSASATLETIDGYRLTVLTAVAAVERVLQRPIERGFTTPALAFGKNFILEFPATDLRWESNSDAAL